MRYIGKTKTEQHRGDHSKLRRGIHGALFIAPRKKSRFYSDCKNQLASKQLHFASTADDISKILEALFTDVRTRTRPSTNVIRAKRT